MKRRLADQFGCGVLIGSVVTEVLPEWKEWRVMTSDQRSVCLLRSLLQKD